MFFGSIRSLRLNILGYCHFTTSILRKKTRQSVHPLTSQYIGGFFPPTLSDRQRSEVNMTDVSQYIQPNDTEVCLLNCKAAFGALTDKEKFYSHHLSQAIWNGTLICMLQVSPESPGMYLLLQKIFRSQGVKKTPKELTDDEFKAIVIYASAVYSNAGNYKSFGDTKIIPNVEKDKFELFVKTSSAYREDPKTIQKLWDRISERMYSLDEKQRQLGLGSKGISSYFSGNCDIKDAEIAQEFLNEKDLSAYNTRLFKTLTDEGTKYEVRIASANKDNSAVLPGVPLGVHNFTSSTGETVSFAVTRGDYAPLLNLVTGELALAKEQAANDNQRAMLGHYITSFTEGSILEHKDGSRMWIKDKGPIIESYVGFIETYRDPFGTRGEFEGFVSMVNKEMSKKFSNLVTHAEKFLPYLPWPHDYEKDTFLRPDFTSLDVLTFGGSGIPAGINIPNYDDIRQSEGFKNVSLGNVLNAQYKESKVSFLGGADSELFTKWKISSFEVQVGLHELLGHGSGKQFTQNADGSFNFKKDVIHTETKQPITTWYASNETWDSKFPVISSSYEECRAECVGIYLCLHKDILKVFGYEGDQAADCWYINWLIMVRAGLLSLEFYTPEKLAWGQAHMQARFVILQVLIEAGENLVTITEKVGEDGKADLLLSLDRDKIRSVGKEAIGNFLRKLQVYKATGDFDAGKKMYDLYSTVPPRFLAMRSIVLARKQPRKMFVQCNTVIEGNKVELVEYDPSPAGLIQSWIERFPGNETDALLEGLWEKDAPHFQ